MRTGLEYFVVKSLASLINLILTSANTSSLSDVDKILRAYFSSIWEDSFSYLYSKYFLTLAYSSFGISFDFKN